MHDLSVPYCNRKNDNINPTDVCIDTIVILSSDPVPPEDKVGFRLERRDKLKDLEF